MVTYSAALPLDVGGVVHACLLSSRGAGTAVLDFGVPLRRCADQDVKLV